MQFGMYREVPSRHMTSLKPSVLKIHSLTVSCAPGRQKKQCFESARVSQVLDLDIYSDIIKFTT